MILKIENQSPRVQNMKTPGTDIGHAPPGAIRGNVTVTDLAGGRQWEHLGHYHTVALGVTEQEGSQNKEDNLVT